MIFPLKSAHRKVKSSETDGERFDWLKQTYGGLTLTVTPRDDVTCAEKQVTRGFHLLNK